MTNKIQSAVLGDAGEHLVLSKLLLQGFIAGLAPTNTKDFDLIITSRDGKLSAPIQVKTTMREPHWRMDKKHEVMIENLIYCFVRINETDHDPEVFVIDAKTVAHVLKKSHQIWLKLPYVNVRKNSKDDAFKEKIDQPMRLLLTDYNKISGLKTIKNNLKKEDKDLSFYLSNSDIKFLEKYPEGWMNRFKNNWKILNR